MSNSVTKAANKATKTTAKVEKRELKDAYIIPQEDGDKMILALAELPIKYSQSIGPIIDILQKGIRGNIDVIMDPNKKAPAPEPEVEMEVKKPK